ncbi:hypothetical protein HDU83_004030 [Entophlyctis luteolus]|nr:hypothetical protein HDU83_004030 [Entophlyctis luteolus]KAJ3383664.1 hypothetical protein HDU84_003451 [Entophlyctis sp. JEL0112]
MTARVSAPASAPSSASASSAKASARILRFVGHRHLRVRLVLAVLARRPVRIDAIRPPDADHAHPGLADYEVSFLRLLEKLTNGSVLEISYTGTSLLFRPGIITGGRISHDCPNSRAIGYFLEPILALAPFCKSPLALTLNGITNDNIDVCVDTLRTVSLPLLRKFLPENTTTPLELKITKRGAPPLGGGQIVFECPCVKSLRAATLLMDPGLGVRRIRGIAYATRISPQMANRVVDAARGLLSRYIPDVYLYTDVYKGAESGKSPGYGVSLVAETTTSCLYSAECAYQVRKKSVNDIVNGSDEVPEFSLDEEASSVAKEGSSVVSQAAVQDTSSATQEGLLNHLENDYCFPTPEDLGIRAARLLLTEIRSGGCVDTSTQWLAILLLALSPEDVGKVRVGALSSYSVQVLRDVRDFLGVVFKIGEEKSHSDENELSVSLRGGVVLTCVGSGYVNVNKNVT